MIMKRWFIICGVVLLAVLVVGIFVGNYFYRLALDPKSEKSTIFEADHNQFSFEPEAEVASNWLESVAYEKMTISSFDDLTLTAYFVNQEQPTHRYAIIAHGYTSHAMQMEYFAKHFYEEGYHVLLPDARGHGESEGNYIGMGWHERLDLVNWIEMIISEDPEAEIVLYGISMGGATVMSTSGEELPHQVKAIVTDCGYTSVKDIFSYQLQALFGLPSFPILNFASLVTYFRAGYTFNEASMVQQLAQSQTPILFIHGDSDAFVPYEMVHVAYEATQATKELYIVEGAGHGEAAQVAGADYWQKVFGFVETQITQQ